MLFVNTRAAPLDRARNILIINLYLNPTLLPRMKTKNIFDFIQTLNANAN